MGSTGDPLPAAGTADARTTALVDLEDALRNLRDPADIAFAAAQILGRTLKVGRVGYATMDARTGVLDVDRDWTAPDVESLSGTFDPGDDTALVDRLKRGEVIAVTENPADQDIAGSSTPNARGMTSCRAFVIAPILERGRLVAVFFVNDEMPRRWSDDDIALIRAFADRTRTAVERARSERALRQSREQYRTLFESIDAGFCVVEVDLEAADGRCDYRVIEANPGFYTQTGFPEEITGLWLRAAAPALEEYWYEMYGRIAATGEPARFEQGSAALGRWFDVYAFRVSEPEDRRVAILFNDISARKNAEERLRMLNDTLEEQVAARAAERDRLWNLSQDMLARADFEGAMSAVSPAWTRILGWSEAELLSRGYASLIHPDDTAPTLAAIENMARTLAPNRFENRIATSTGGWKHIEWTVAPEPDGVNFIGVGRDLTLTKQREAELASAQEALRQSQKMEAIGSLTGGVAHDFNNLLTPIVGSLDLLKRRGVGTAREQRLIEGAIQSADRAKTLVQRLLAFARRQPLQPMPVDAGLLVRNMADLVASTTGPQIQVIVNAAPDLPAAMADPNQLEMALLNLAVNARDAMPEGGTLRIDAAARAVVERKAGEVSPGAYVVLSVTDSGIGMDEATLARAVEPFFSTKGVGRGTGLGLSMVHGLALQLGGALTIDSKPGVGTNIELWLPVSAMPVPASAQPDADLAPFIGAGTALLVDDEQLVRSSVADMLGDLGYDVVEANCAEHALQLVEEGLTPSLLVTDHLMPGMTGTQLARRLQARQPDLQLLIVSGYAEVDSIEADLPRLTKPFRSDELATILATARPLTA